MNLLPVRQPDPTERKRLRLRRSSLCELAAHDSKSIGGGARFYFFAIFFSENLKPDFAHKKNQTSDNWPGS
ncbi:hypothetical protein [Flavonifractor sp. An9]|uniref:hypothetical protein n=1 Tax=Flavonifractor sp. An9 TaxID=1965664 RepID=UPI0013028CED|nr:hypothetical protein [Flavonifractor sp. An9]